MQLELDNTYILLIELPLPLPNWSDTEIWSNLSRHTVNLIKERKQQQQQKQNQ